MQTTRIGQGSVQTTRLGFGTSRLHYLSSGAARQALLAKAADLGIRHFDTAPLYGHGIAEREIGRFVRGRRDEFIVATKYGLPPSPWIDGAGALALPLISARSVGQRLGIARTSRPLLTASGLRQSVEASLQRLGTDYLDIHFLHEPELRRIPSLGDLIEEYERLLARGLVRAFGVAGSYAECLAIKNEIPLNTILQVPEREWNDAAIPDVTFGVLTAKPQLFFSSSAVSSGVVLDAVSAAMKRRDSGVVLVSTRREAHLEALVKALDGSAAAPAQKADL